MGWVQIHPFGSNRDAERRTVAGVHLQTSNCSEDASFAGTARKRPVKDPNGVAQALRDGLVFDYIQRVELKSWKSYRPLGQIALDMDLVHIAWAMDLAKKYSSARQMLAINVDCVIVKIAKVQYEKLAKAAAELKYADGSPKLRLKSRNAATYDGDVRVKDAPPPVADASTPRPVGPWRDAENPSADVVTKALLEDSGALLVGVGGTGKRTWPKRSFSSSAT